MDSYDAGTGSSQIVLKTDITTIGLAGSRATLFTPGSNNSTAVAHSVNATGDIPPSAIGAAFSVKNKRMSVMSKIDLSIVGNLEDRKAEFAKITSSYTLEGGDEQFKRFEALDDDVTHADDFSTVLIFKTIDIL